MSDSTSPGVRVERGGAVVRLILDRPARHNALRAVDVAALRSALDESADDPEVRVLVLTGSGDRTFCAGASLREMESGAMSGELFDTLTDHLATVPLPTVCALNGSAYGGGAELALCCDFRIGTPETTLSVPAARLGVCYPIGGLERYVRRLGLPAASRILLAAEEMDAGTLEQIGFLTHLVARDELEATTEELTHRLARLAPLAVRSMKSIMMQIAAGALDASAAREAIRACSESEDLREGLAARREGREPRFEGR